MNIKKNTQAQGIVKKIVTGRCGTMVELETQSGQSIATYVATAAASRMGLQAGMLVAAVAVGREVTLSIIS
jgi:molybdopterin-binding protein